MDIGNKIKKRRFELGLTLEEVGSMVGVGKSTVRKWETGAINNMGRSKISLLAKALQVPPTFLLDFEETPVHDLPNITKNSEINVKNIYGESEYLKLSDVEKIELEKTIKNAILLKKMEFEDK